MTLKVALVGATGAVGSHILTELTARGHFTLAIARQVDSIAPQSLVTPRQVDGTVSDLADALSGQEAVISAARFVDLDPDWLLPAVLRSGVKRYIVSGGAGILLNKDGIRVADAPELPEAARLNSQRGIYLLELLRETTALEWTYVAPSMSIEEGARTGVFRVGSDHLLYDSTGRSHISYQDLAMAVVDELEAPKHPRALFTIGY